MRVEILGGPRDGEVLQVRDGTHEIFFPVKSPRAWQTYGTEETGLVEPTFEAIVLPILRGTNGKFYVKWKENE